MRFRTYAFAMLLVVAATALHADEFLQSITPSSGPAEGYTTVTLKGNFSNFEYTVLFGNTPALSSQRVDAQTIVAVTPPHVPGEVEVKLFEYDMIISTDQKFTFTGRAEDVATGYLLPILAPPVFGAYGSEFRTKLTGLNTSEESFLVYGLDWGCDDGCGHDRAGDGLMVFSNRSFDESVSGDLIAYNAPNGRIIYVDKGRERGLVLNLRVYDVSQNALNFGTEITVPRLDEFGEVITLAGVPADPRFRHTLRIYSPDGDAAVKVSFRGEEHTVHLTGGNGQFEPSYAAFTDFPASGDPYAVTIRDVDGCEICSPPLPGKRIWAFMTVTNNATQTITTITPQR